MKLGHDRTVFICSHTERVAEANPSEVPGADDLVRRAERAAGGTLP